MAEKKEKEPKAKSAKAKKLRSVTHHKATGGGFVHEHEYEDGTKNFAGFSPDIADVHQHIDDHLAPEAEAAPEQAAAAPGGGGPPAGGPGGAGPGEEPEPGE